ncbi:hypothetical protein JHK82_049932 [Glycine max]|nr:hypothetical protein JHK86_049808 [Glycine max]KAG5091154.1 hypothetical protein JHK82_049932 [Glycine max]
MDQTIGLEECKAKCLDNCSCMAYANLDISGQGSVCAMWFDDLIDIRLFAAGGQDVYVQIDASELGILKDGEEISVKRLLGCCLEGEEKMLVYEYMLNGSLDSFIFGMDIRDELYFKWLRLVS